ncbi:branched-chain amino acid transport system ATP-binding protein [Enhydrobacter aerosaccus]|uniref:Branched-chain amino acid transport system ATP-binding protein n=1 Tax=Enhydrobacter aerosaccus TaxID=225324 RepID=A0A1T4SI32_9HYPH|nr:ABC transporter ATP-binding protein [Enhydrobacter aerosaccus]SKA27815.1 branched-chain amino acid transport system ATP-binding protein [Enhydrobacter aerosaccus]
MTAPLLTVDQLTKRFGGFVALDQVSLQVAQGERLGLIGPNGSGKSTLVNCISGTVPISSGRVLLDRERIDRLPPHRRAQLGLVRSFQLPRPFGSLTIADNLKVAMLYAGKPSSDSIHDLLALLGLEDKAGRLPRELTQIEMRKLELARAMAANPRLLIVDEVMAGLSHAEVDEIVELLLRLNEAGVTIVMIEHIMRAVMAFSQRLVCIVAGRKVADGDPREVTGDAHVLKAYLGE